MKVTFKNENEKGNIEEAGMRSLESTKEDIKQFALDELNEGESEFFEYGLSFSTVWVDDDVGGEIEYHKFQLSWGGPSSEIRFHASGKIEYVFLDWFCGVGFDVTGEEWAQWAESQLLCC